MTDRAELTREQVMREEFGHEEIIKLAADRDALKEEVEQWRQWVQFVWKDGGPVRGDDKALQSVVCHAFDDLTRKLADYVKAFDQIRDAKAEDGRLIESLQQKLAASEQAMKVAKDEVWRAAWLAIDHVATREEFKDYCKLHLTKGA